MKLEWVGLTKRRNKSKGYTSKHTIYHPKTKTNILCEILPTNDVSTITSRQNRRLTTLVLQDRLDALNYQLCNAIIRTPLPECRNVHLILPHSYYTCSRPSDSDIKIESVEDTLKHSPTPQPPTHKTTKKNFLTKGDKREKQEYLPTDTHKPLEQPKERQPVPPFLLIGVSTTQKGEILPDSMVLMGPINPETITRVNNDHLTFLDPTTPRQRFGLAIARTLIAHPRPTKRAVTEINQAQMQDLSRRILDSRPPATNYDLSPLEMYMWLNNDAIKYHTMRKYNGIKSLQPYSISRRQDDNAPHVQSDFQHVLNGNVKWTALTLPPVSISPWVTRYDIPNLENYLSPPILVNK